MQQYNDICVWEAAVEISTNPHRAWKTMSTKTVWRPLNESASWGLSFCEVKVTKTSATSHAWRWLKVQWGFQGVIWTRIRHGDCRVSQGSRIILSPVSQRQVFNPNTINTILDRTLNKLEDKYFLRVWNLAFSFDFSFAPDIVPVHTMMSHSSGN